MACYVENWSGWRQAIRDSGRRFDAEELTTEDKLADLARLVQSGLPTYEYTTLPLSDFHGGNPRVTEIYARYGGQIVARALAPSGTHQRFTCIGKSMEEAAAFFQSRIPEYLRGDYVALLNEYDPAAYCGVVLSAPAQLIIEMVEDANLEALCHGHVTPWHGRFAEAAPYSFARMAYSGDVPPDARLLMWQVVRRLSRRECEDAPLPRFLPREGYFEFVFSARTGHLRFLEYKPLQSFLPKDVGRARGIHDGRG